MKHFSDTIEVTTTSHLQFLDITDRVKKAVASSGIANGIVHVYSAHTTAAVKVNERCDRLQKDMTVFLETLAPQGGAYRHNDGTVDGRDNAHSHLRALMLGASESLPLAAGVLTMGAWQSVFFVELDGPREGRQVTITVMGE